MKKLMINWMQKSIQNDAKHNTLLSRHAPFWAVVSVVCIFLSVVGFTFDWSVLYGFIYNATGAVYVGAASAGVIALIIQVMIVGGTSMAMWTYSRRLHKDEKRWKLQMRYAATTAMFGLLASLYLSWHTDTAVYAVSSSKAKTLEQEIFAQQKQLTGSMKSQTDHLSTEYHRLRKATNADYDRQAKAIVNKYESKIAPYVKRKNELVLAKDDGGARWVQKRYIDRYSQQMADALAALEVKREKALSSILSSHESKMNSVAGSSTATMKLMDQMSRDRLTRFSSDLESGAHTMRGFNIAINLLVALLTGMIIVFYRDAEKDIKGSHSPTPFPRFGGGGGGGIQIEDNDPIEDLFSDEEISLPPPPQEPEHVTTDKALHKEINETPINTEAKEEKNFAEQYSSTQTLHADKVYEAKIVSLPKGKVIDYTYHVKNARENWRNAHKPAAKKKTTLSRLEKVQQHAAVLADMGYNIEVGDKPDRLIVDSRDNPSLPPHSYTVHVGLDGYGRPALDTQENLSLNSNIA